MGKSLFIAEKPSVAAEFAKALDMPLTRKDGRYEDDDNIVTWCVGHLIEMSYPEKYDPELAKWNLETIPFIPDRFKYEVKKEVADQYKVVKELLNRSDVSKIYYSGDSAREGEYIQRLVRQVAGHNPSAEEYRVWIDSQTRDEILKGIRTAHELSYYDALSDSAYARAIEDYLVGINFSRALSLKYGNLMARAVDNKYRAIAVGRVMSCVLGMIVARERQIRSTSIIPFYGIKAKMGDSTTADWKLVEGSQFFNSPDNYENKGLLKKEITEQLIAQLNSQGTLTVVDKKQSVSKKAAPLLFNLAELQAECTKRFHISPADALQCAQNLYEAKLTTYPRTDARVLTTAIVKEIDNNVSGLSNLSTYKEYVDKIHGQGWLNKLSEPKCKYVNDAAVADHYAIIPTGQGFDELSKLSGIDKKVYDLICRRFLSIMYPETIYDKLAMTYKAGTETFAANYTAIKEEGFLEVAGKATSEDKEKEENEGRALMDAALAQSGTIQASFELHEGKSQPPKRYTTGSMILAMENAGNLIEDEELREQIKGSGIGTSATRAEVITKLEKNQYIVVNKKTQVIQPAVFGEIIYDILQQAVPQILVPQYTASWEMGLQQIVDKKITKDVYLGKIYNYVRQGTGSMKQSDFSAQIEAAVAKLKSIYPEIGKAAAVNDVIGQCPNCQGDVKAGGFGVYCTNKCGMSFGYAFGKQLTPENVKALLAGKRVLLKGLTSKKTGNNYDMYITAVGIEPYSYMKKDGQKAEGAQFKFETELPEFKKSKFKKK